MKAKLILLALTISFIAGCHNPPNKPELKKEIEFNVGFDPRSKYAGTYFDKKTLTEYIYFADPVTKKCIKTFTSSGKLIDSIPLKEAIHFLGEIDGIVMTARDTIIIHSLYTNKLAAINKQGNCWHKIDLNNLATDKQGNHYEFSSPWMPNFVLDKNTLLLSCHWRYNILDIANKKEPENTLEHVQYFCKNKFESPYLVKISGYLSSSPKADFVLNGFRKNISKTPEDFTEQTSYKCVDKNIFLFSTYSDLLFKVNRENMTLEKKIKISSDFTRVGAKTTPINASTLPKLQDITLFEGRRKGFIQKIYYDKTHKEFYLCIFHDISRPEEEKRQGAYRPFSIIIYDDQFNNPKEYAFTDGNYASGFNIMTTEGLMMCKKNNSQNLLNNGKLTFTIFDFKK